MPKVIVRVGESWLQAYIRTKYGERAAAISDFAETNRVKGPVGPEFEFDDL